MGKNFNCFMHFTFRLDSAIFIFSFLTDLDTFRGQGKWPHFRSYPWILLATIFFMTFTPNMNDQNIFFDFLHFWRFAAHICKIKTF